MGEPGCYFCCICLIYSSLSIKLLEQEREEETWLVWHLEKEEEGGEGIDEYAKNLVIKKVSLQKFSGRGQSRGCN